MRLCYFGDYNPEHVRTQVLLVGLMRRGITVTHCNVPREGGIVRYWKLWRRHRLLRGGYDVLLVGSGSPGMALFGRFLSKKPLVWDAFDVPNAPECAPKDFASAFSQYCRLKERAFAAADLILSDTAASIEIFHEAFHVAPEKFLRVFLGADDAIFFPHEKTRESETFEIVFWGDYSAPRGALVLVQAAQLLAHDRVHISMIGDGEECAPAKALAKEIGAFNVTFYPFLTRLELLEHLRNAEVCIGFLGNAPVVMHTIPALVYEAAAMACVSITAQSPALREVFLHGTDVVAVVPGDPEDTARAIRELAHAKGRAEKMGKAAYKTFTEKAKPEIIARDLVAAITKAFHLEPTSK